MHATYDDANGQPTLRFERRLAHPVHAVWRAITDPGELARWFPTRVKVDLRVGGAMSFHFEHMPLDAPTEMDGRVTELDPPRVFAFLWGRDHLRFELEPAGGGQECRLRFTVGLDAADKAARDAAGWHGCLDALAAALPGPSAPAAGGGWRERYEHYAAAGLPTGAEIPDSV